MHLAILMTNTDKSDFARAHPGDDEKFTALIHLVRPDWSIEVFPVMDDVFPDDLSRFDGVVITGSPASVHDNTPWVGRLLHLIREMHADGMPMFGACFGHQAIALALGGKVDKNPGGWVFGLTRNAITGRPAWTCDLPDQVRLYGCHKEHVSQLPQGATCLTRTDTCDVTGFSIGNHVYTTQQHPEMTREFIAALGAEMANELDPEMASRVNALVAGPSDMEPYATSISRFFELAQDEN